MRGHDAVLFEYQGYFHVEHIEGLPTPTQKNLPAHMRLVLLRLSVEVEAEEGNTFVNLFGHRRYGYDFSSETFSITVVVEQVSMVQQIMAVVDPY